MRPGLNALYARTALFLSQVLSSKVRNWVYTPLKLISDQLIKKWRFPSSTGKVMMMLKKPRKKTSWFIICRVLQGFMGSEGSGIWNPELANTWNITWCIEKPSRLFYSTTPSKLLHGSFSRAIWAGGKPFSASEISWQSACNVDT